MLVEKYGWAIQKSLFAQTNQDSTFSHTRKNSKMFNITSRAYGQGFSYMLFLFVLQFHARGNIFQCFFIFFQFIFSFYLIFLFVCLFWTKSHWFLFLKFPAITSQTAKLQNIFPLMLRERTTTIFIQEEEKHLI